MTTVMKLLSLLMCFELITGPIKGSIIFSNPAEAMDCPKGQVYNAEVNRCQVSEQVMNTNNAVDSCRSITDEAARKKCYKDNASARFNESREAELAKCASITDKSDKKLCEKKYAKDEDRSGLLKTDEDGNTRVGGYGSSAAAVAVPLFFIIKAMSDKQGPKTCKPASLVLLYAGGASLLIGEVVSYIKHRKNIKEMNKAREALTVSENTGNTDDNQAVATEAQSQSFELLAQNEDSIAEVAKTKKITYGIATGLFAAGAIMATVESFQLRTAYKNLANTNPAVVSQAQATIKRLTCSQDSQGNTADKTTGSNPNGTTPGSGNGKTDGFTKVSQGLGAAGAVKGLLPVKEENTTTGNPGSKDKEEEVNCAVGTDAESCGGISGCTWNPLDADAGTCDKTTSININELLNQEIKTKAAKNIQHARSYQEMMELLAEIDSLEYENYSRTSYFDGNPLMESLNKVGFSNVISKVVSESFIKNAHAMGPYDPEVEGDLSGSGVNGGDVITKMEGDVTQSSTNGSKVGEGKTGVKKIMDKAVYTPQGRLITNGLLGGWMAIMTSHMSKQQKISNARAELLRGIKSDFDTQTGINVCTSKDRENPGKPRCYCFTSDNKQNSARSKSKICNTQLANLKYDVKGLAATPKVCVDQNFGVDASCSCRSRKGKDGKNTCMKVGSSFNLSGLNPGTFKMISAASSPANDLLNGNASVGDMDSGAIGANAARIKKVADDSLAKNKVASKATKDMEKALLRTTNGMTMGGSGFAQKSMAKLSPKEASAELAKELEKKDEIEVNTAGATGDSAPAEAPAEEAPEFGMTEDMAAAQETEIAEVMSQNLDMGGNDINSGSNTNIFEVLSNRYQRSGMRRLFDEKGETKADAPAKSEIVP